MFNYCNNRNINFLGAKYYKDYEKAKETQGVIHQFDDHLDNDTNQNNTPSGGEDITPDIDLNELIASNNNNGNSGDSSKVTYRGYEVMGKIKIPTTGLETIILEKVTPSSIESSVAILYGPGLNKVGNTVIVGHNYRNGQMFSNNKNLSIGDKIYITDKTGTEVAYTITKNIKRQLKILIMQQEMYREEEKYHFQHVQTTQMEG